MPVYPLAHINRPAVTRYLCAPRMRRCRVKGSAHLLPREPRAWGQALGDALRQDGSELFLGVHAEVPRGEGDQYL
jgi:hypothetical protein